MANIDDMHDMHEAQNMHACSANACITWHAAFMAPSRLCDMDGWRLDWQSAHFMQYSRHDLYVQLHIGRYAVWPVDAMHLEWQLEQHKDV